MNQDRISKSYEIAKEHYAEYGVDTDAVLRQMKQLSISLHCWQADDVGGFENPDAQLSGGGIQATGNYPGKARNLAELQRDIEKVMSLLPGKQKLNIHASYGDFTGQKKVDRDAITIDNYKPWLDWAKKQEIGLDFNCTCFSHPKADSGFTITSKDANIRKFWLEHIKRCREVAAQFGKKLGIPAIHNLWIPDGSKDIPVDRAGHRKLLKEALDDIFAINYSKDHMKDSIESKLFGIGSEAMVVGSYDFYWGYAAQNNKLICLDNGHYHPTEQVSDKISACLLFVDELMLHVTRGVRWDSDHVVILNDEIQGIFQEIVRANALDRVNVGLDFFDASINRIGAYITGTRAAQKALLFALLEPRKVLLNYEENGQNFERLFLLEKMKSMPWGAVWDYYCLQENVIDDDAVICEVQKYEKEVLSKR
ncbi:MAG: L-rhamnose isomerase [Fidelibacterota bacterium]